MREREREGERKRERESLPLEMRHTLLFMKERMCSYEAPVIDL